MSDARETKDWLERLGNKRAGILLLVMVGVGGFSLGAGLVLWGDEQLGLPDRVKVLEEQLSVIAENTAGVATLTEDVRVIRTQVSELYCDRWPELCVAAPGGPQPEGGGNE